MAPRGANRRPGREAAGDDAPLVLLADDYADYRDACARLLRAVGFRVATAATAEDAIAAVRALRPAVVVMDLSMPDGDGITATMQLKSDPSTSAVPVIAYTGLASPQLETRARAAGCERLLQKSGDIDALVEAVRVAVAGSRRSSARRRDPQR